MCGGYLFVFFNMKKQYLIFYYNGHSKDIDLNFLNLNKINKQIFLIYCSGLDPKQPKVS